MDHPLKVFLQSCIFLLLLANTNQIRAQWFFSPAEKWEEIAEEKLSDIQSSITFDHTRYILKVDSVKIPENDDILNIYFSETLEYLPIRPETTAQFKKSISELLGRKYRKFNIEIFSGTLPVSELIPNYYRAGKTPIDSLRFRDTKNTRPLVSWADKENYTHGLSGTHIALWHSHGLYFNQEKQRWQWQRARLFGTVEDLFPMQYVLKYIAPMLENAGAVTLIPRERDTNIHEVIVDNDRSHKGSAFEAIHPDIYPPDTLPGGFLLHDTIFGTLNPFESGSYTVLKADKDARFNFTPKIPEKGDYAVYASWGRHPENLEKVNLEIRHSGGLSNFTINQQMGWGTWVYLGHFHFEKGFDSQKGGVSFFVEETQDGVITADAVKFGGGEGNIARGRSDQLKENKKSATDRNNTQNNTHPPHNSSKSQTVKSGFPRFAEGARYFMQYAGFPYREVYSINEGRNDYNDDYMSRGEWVNYMTGSPLGPTSNRNIQGLNIPVDLSFSFHTDAGITQNDSVIGTLAIYSSERDGGLFPDGVSKMVNRDMTDIIQTQIVEDIRHHFDPDWTRRFLWNKQYSEAWRPNVPSILLELLSHQNLSDMKYGLHPDFQFHVSRAIYKGITRFHNFQRGVETVIQPLPPSHIDMERIGNKRIKISWKETNDPLEETAKADYFMVYTRVGNAGFDNGIRVDKAEYTTEIKHWDTVYSFRITAVNAGGESMPSETLAAGFTEKNEELVLIVNGFDRVSAPGFFDTGTLAGITWWDDMMVDRGRSTGFTGMQYDYDRNSAWLDDDSPGWGASYANYEGSIIAGNTFNYPFLHGKSVLRAGYSFISTSRKAFDEKEIKNHKYWCINWIAGKQKPGGVLASDDDFVIFTNTAIDKLNTFTSEGGNIFLTGAYIGTSLKDVKRTKEFTKETLGYFWRTNHASTIADICPAVGSVAITDGCIQYNNTFDDDYYIVEAPDAIEPANANSQTVLRYRENQKSAAILFTRERYSVFAAGFPFESIKDEQQRDHLIYNVFNFFKQNKK